MFSIIWGFNIFGNSAAPPFPGPPHNFDLVVLPPASFSLSFFLSWEVFSTPTVRLGSLGSFCVGPPHFWPPPLNPHPPGSHPSGPPRKKVKQITAMIYAPPTPQPVGAPLFRWVCDPFCANPAAPHPSASTPPSSAFLRSPSPSEHFGNRLPSPGGTFYLGQFHWANFRISALSPMKIGFLRRAKILGPEGGVKLRKSGAHRVEGPMGGGTEVWRDRNFPPSLFFFSLG